MFRAPIQDQTGKYYKGLGKEGVWGSRITLTDADRYSAIQILCRIPEFTGSKLGDFKEFPRIRAEGPRWTTKGPAAQVLHEKPPSNHKGFSVEASGGIILSFPPFSPVLAHLRWFYPLTELFFSSGTKNSQR